MPAKQLLSSSVLDFASLDDTELVARAQRGEAPAFRAIMQRYNRRLYRVARGIVRDDGEAEDVVQEAYMRAFAHLRHFRGEASFSTWLTRITLNEALGRVRRRRGTVDIEVLDRAAQGDSRILMFPTVAGSNPEADAAQAQVRTLLERAIDELPDAFRTVFVMRAIEEMSIEETASQLGLRPETVKTRLHRARRLLRQALDRKLVSVLKDAFPFDGARCDRMTGRVLERLTSGTGSPTLPDLRQDTDPETTIMQDLQLSSGGNPQSTAKIAGHPLHPMLIPFPIAFLVATFVCDLAFWRTANAAWATASLWLLGAALVMAALAAVTGLTDFAGDQRIRDLADAWHHMIGNVVAVLLALFNWYRRYESGDAAVLPWGMVLSFLVVAILLFTGWKGWEMVYRHRVGVADENRPA